MEDKGHMVDAMNAIRGKEGRRLRAKYQSGPGIVDHGFVSEKLRKGVTDYNIISRHTESDHSVVTFTVKLPQKKHHHHGKHR
jgi:hypothetical protein